MVSEDTGIKISDFLFSVGIRTTALRAKKLALKQEPNQFFLIKFGDFSIKNYELFWKGKRLFSNTSAKAKESPKQGRVEGPFVEYKPAAYEADVQNTFV